MKLKLGLKHETFILLPLHYSCNVIYYQSLPLIVFIKVVIVQAFQLLCGKVKVKAI